MSRVRRAALVTTCLVLLSGCSSGAAVSPGHWPTGAAGQVSRSSATRAAGSATRAADVPHSERVTPATLRALGGRVLNLTYPAPSMHGRRHVLVLLPRGYSRTTARYPVVELLHGHPGGPLDLFMRGRGDLLAYDTASGIAPFIAVIPDGHGPVVDDSWWADIPSQHLATAVTRDLRRWAGAKFRTSGSWSYAGISTGGYAAAYLPSVDTQPVHAECALSGYYDATKPPIPHNSSVIARLRYSPIAHARHAPPVVFLSYGRSDPRTMRQTEAYVAALHAAHHAVTVRVYPGRHQWRVWRPGFEQCLRLVVPAHGT